MPILTMIASVPDVIWSGVIASLLTLSGVLLSNWSNTNRLKIQLKHDSDEKTKERLAMLRKEVYLNAAEESIKANAYLGSLSQVDFSKTNAGEGMHGFFAAAAKLQLISKPKTSLQVSELVSTYGELLFKAMAKVRPIQKLQTDIAIRDDHYHRAQAEVSRVLAAMTQFNEAAKTDDAVFKALNISFDFQQGQANKFASERSALWVERNRLHLAFIREFVVDMKLAGERQMQVMVELRRELDVGGDVDAFIRQMDAQWKRMKTQLETLLDDLERA
ncbi:MAG: hypothetical protein ABIQ90_01455 [Polaromonas sp.]